MNPPPIRRRLQVKTHLCGLTFSCSEKLKTYNTQAAYLKSEKKHPNKSTLFFHSFSFKFLHLYMLYLDWSIDGDALGLSEWCFPPYLLLAQATRTWRPSSPGTTRPSGRPSSERYNCVTWISWSQPDGSLSALLWYSVHSPAGVRHSHGSAAGHSGHCCTLLILVTTPLIFLLVFLLLLLLWLNPDLNTVNVCLHSAPVRFFIQTHPGLYMAS